MGGGQAKKRFTQESVGIELGRWIVPIAQLIALFIK